MTYLAQILGQRLGQNLGQDMSPSDVIARFADTSFTNASDRMLSYGSNFPSVESFAGGTLATRRIGGRLFAQVEAAVENAYTETQDIDDNDWTKYAIQEVTADGTVAPDGSLTADLVIPSTSSDHHYIGQAITSVLGTSYVMSAYAKAGAYNTLEIAMGGAMFVGSPSIMCDLDAGTYTTSGDEDRADMEDVGNGWYRCWVAATSDAVDTVTPQFYVHKGTRSFAGDGSSGVYVWNPQWEIGTHPSSPIHAQAAAVTRAKDQLKWASADVPVALRQQITFKWIPRHDEAVASNISLIEFDASGSSGNVHVYFKASDDKIYVTDDAASQYAVTDALEFDRNQIITITLNPAQGSITISGANAGDGTYSSAPWSTSEGDVWLGMNESAAQQINGLISEPY